MFSPFFDSTIYDDKDLIDVLKVENLLFGIAMAQFGRPTKPSKDSFRDILCRYVESFDMLDHDVRPCTEVYRRLINEQFDHMYEYFFNECDFMNVKSYSEIINEICEKNVEFNDYMDSIRSEDLR